MTDSLADLLEKRQFDEPPEIALIKGFVQDHFKQKPEVIVGEKQITIGVKGSALAGALRPLLPKLKDQLATTKRLVIRIQ